MKRASPRINSDPLGLHLRQHQEPPPDAESDDSVLSVPARVKQKKRTRTWQINRKHRESASSERKQINRQQHRKQQPQHQRRARDCQVFSSLQFRALSRSLKS